MCRVNPRFALARHCYGFAKPGLKFVGKMRTQSSFTVLFVLRSQLPDS
jgi:hypothetical protein